MDSFALTSNGGVVLQQPQATSGSIQTQILGGGVSGSASAGHAPAVVPSNFDGIADSGMKTLTVLNTLAQGALKPYVDAEQKRLYFEGMSKVAQGQALQDVEKDQPWYTQIFGPSATVRGAQAMAATTAVTQAQTDFLQAMPDLKTKSPDEVRKFLVSQASNIKSTGDPLVDATVQAKLAEGWGGMLTTHMKEHIAWQQEDMADKQVNLNVTNGNALRAARQAAVKTGWADEDRQVAYENYLASAEPAPGQSQQSWTKGMVRSLKANLDSGNFDAYTAVKESPLWRKLPGDAREHLESLLPAYVQKDARSNPAVTDILNNLSGFEFNLSHGMTGIHSDKEFNAVVDGYNQRHQTQTGSNEPLINNTQRAHMYKQWLAGNLALEKTAAAAQSKQDNFIQSGTLALTAFNSGRFDALHGLTLDPKAVGDAMNEAFHSAVQSGDPVRMQTFFDKAGQSASEEKMRPPELSAIFKTQIPSLLSGNGPVTSNQQQALQYAAMLYKSPTGGASALSHYLGEDAPKVISLLNSGVDINDSKQLLAQREVIARGGSAVATEADRKQMRQIVVNADPGFFRKMLGHGLLSPFELNDGNKRALADQVAPMAAQYARAYRIDYAEAGQIVLSQVTRNADFVPGAFVLHNPAVRAEESLGASVNRILPGKGNQSTSIYQDALKEMIRARVTDKVRQNGGDTGNFDPDDYEVGSGEQIGAGQLMLFMFPKALSGTTHGPLMIQIGAGRDRNDPDGLAYWIEHLTEKKAHGGWNQPMGLLPAFSPQQVPF